MAHREDGSALEEESSPLLSEIEESIQSTIMGGKEDVVKLQVGGGKSLGPLSHEVTSIEGKEDVVEGGKSSHKATQVDFFDIESQCETRMVEEEEEELLSVKEVDVNKEFVCPTTESMLTRQRISSMELLPSLERRHYMVDNEPKLPVTFILKLAFQSIGVVFGDLGISPLYVFSSTFERGINDDQDILGVLSLIIYTIIAIPLVKYTFIVLYANDNGEGGTFSLYSLICQHAKIGLSHDHQSMFQNISSFKLKTPPKKLARETHIKEWLKRSKFWQNVLFVVVLLGPCLVIGDGSLTPAISILSAIEGIGVQVKTLSSNIEVIITIGILLCLFNFQRFGTHRVAFLFGPIMLLWFSSIGIIGIVNIIQWDSTICKAFNPYYAITYFIRNGYQAWASLGGIVLCVTGAEAMFADLGHFNIKSMQIAFTSLVFPSIMCSYIGQAAFLMKNQSVDDVGFTFYRSLPKSIYWPMFVVATCAAIIASQAMISASYSMIRNAMALGCFPRVTIIHTNKKVSGQIYIPELNWILMVLSIAIVGGFRRTKEIGNAYGIAVVGVFFISTCLLTFIMAMIWQTNIIMCGLFFIVFAVIEGTFFLAVLSKVAQGGWVPLTLAVCFMIIMYSWHFGTKMKRSFEDAHKLSSEWLLSLGNDSRITRVPGIGLVYTEVPQGVPSIVAHGTNNMSAMHSIVVFICFRHISVSTIPEDERIVIWRCGPHNHHMFRCAIRYGYTDFINGPNSQHTLESMLLASLEKFIAFEEMDTTTMDDANNDTGIYDNIQQQKKSVEEQPHNYNKETISELMVFKEAREARVVYILGDYDIHAKEGSSFCKKIVIDYIYHFLRLNCRTNSLYLGIPKQRLLKVGMEYYV